MSLQSRCFSATIPQYLIWNPSCMKTPRYPCKAFLRTHFQWQVGNNLLFWLKAKSHFSITLHVDASTGCTNIQSPHIERACDQARNQAHSDNKLGHHFCTLTESHKLFSHRGYLVQHVWSLKYRCSNCEPGPMDQVQIMYLVYKQDSIGPCVLWLHLTLHIKATIWKPSLTSL